MNLSRAKARILLVAVLICPLVSCQGPPSGNDLYSEFKKYRVTLEEQPEEALPYFSRAIVSEWLAGLIFSNPVPTIRQIDLTRREYLFGLRINAIHRYEVTRVKNGRWKLTLYYTGSQEEGLRKLGLEYIRENNRLVIDFFDYDLESHGPPPDNVIDRF